MITWSVVMDPMHAGSCIVNFIVNFIRDGTLSLRVTLKSTTLVCMRSSNVWTMKSWQRREWRLGFNSVLQNHLSRQYTSMGFCHNNALRCRSLVPAEYWCPLWWYWCTTWYFAHFHMRTESCLLWHLQSWLLEYGPHRTWGMTLCTGHNHFVISAPLPQIQNEECGC